jgi:Astacin (Peptidase family M12A)
MATTKELEELREEISATQDNWEKRHPTEPKHENLLTDNRDADRIIPCAYQLPRQLLRKSNHWSFADSAKDGDKSAILADLLWRPPNPTVVKVRFIGQLFGKPIPIQTIGMILKDANLGWLTSPYLHMRFVPWVPRDGASHVRVTFEYTGWFYSQHGTEALDYDQDVETMSLGFEKEDFLPRNRARYLGYVLHEFGHALGAVHEHQSPNFPYHWERDYIIEYYNNCCNWDEPTVDVNVINQYSSATASEFDPNSVMLYAFPKEFTKERVATQENARPSPRDLQSMRALYTH